MSATQRRRPSMALARVSLLDPSRRFSLSKREPWTSTNFSGKWSLDLKRSDDQSELLREQGVPWVARVAIAGASRQVLIEQDGLEWTETIITKILTKTHSMLLDGSTHQETSPVDKSTLIVTSQYEEGGTCVLTTTKFADGVRVQLCQRYLVDEDKTYMVVNTLKLANGREIKTKSYFNRVS